MGKRHGKNATANPVYSYAELQKDNKFSGYGAVEVRLGKDSVKEFDCCSLTLQDCKNPVITPEGILFDKEAILECIVHQKLEYAKKLKAYDQWKKRKEAEKQSAADALAKSNMEKFRKANMSVTTTSSSSDDSRSKISNFWGSAAVNNDAVEHPMQKPEKGVFCPVTGKPIKASDLIPIKFTPMIDDDKTPMASKKIRYMCAVTRDALTNSVPCAVLRTSGNVVTVDCVNTLIRKDMVDPTNGKKMTEDDIIYLERGGSSYSGSGVKLSTKVSKPSMSLG